MPTKDEAFVVHRTATRIRIKIPNRRRQKSYFEALQKALSKHPDVRAVSVSPLTAGIVIECRPGFELTAQNEQLVGVEIAAAEISPPANGQRHERARPNGAIDGRPVTMSDLSSFLLKLLATLAMKPLATQLLEWVIETFVQAAARQAWQATRREALERPQMLLVAMTQ